MEVHTSELEVKGRIGFGALTQLKYDIMGPFKFIPFMECRHSVWSMRHPVNGEVNINGKIYSICSNKICSNKFAYIHVIH